LTPSRPRAAHEVTPVVNYPHTTLDGITEGKIDGACNYAYNQYVNENNGKMSRDALYKGANEAGQVFEVQTVESVTGVHGQANHAVTVTAIARNRYDGALPGFYINDSGTGTGHAAASPEPCSEFWSIRRRGRHRFRPAAA
jgi:hypothetical protein